MARFYPAAPTQGDTGAAGSGGVCSGYVGRVEHEVRFEPSGREIRVPAGTSLLEAARAAGLPVASACGADGICGRCGLAILAGGERLAPESEAEARVKRANRIDPELRLACRIDLASNLVVTAPYWSGGSTEPPERVRPGARGAGRAAKVR
ncbi:MAG: 2Fe-2S iron-sulfur cluster-binding protein [Myxococcota bacterium]